MTLDLSEQTPIQVANQTSRSGGEKTYGRSVRASVRGLLTGVFDEFQFIDSMVSTVNRGLTRAWVEGMKKNGVTEQDLDSPDFLQERLALDQLINDNLSRLFNLSGYILQQRQSLYTQGQKQTAITRSMNRALLWTNQYDKARQHAFVMTSENAKLQWIVGPTEHCTTCALFDKRVYRADTWARYDALPRSQTLCCRGYRCQCQLIPTTDPITKGRFPVGALCNYRD